MLGLWFKTLSRKDFEVRKAYASDITREQFSIIEPILLSARKRTRPRILDLYEIFCAVLYVLKTGCQWRSVYFYFQIWNERVFGLPSVLEKALKKCGLRYSYQGRT